MNANPPLLESLEFHNACPEPRETGAWHLPRYPNEVRHALNDRARIASMNSCGAEIRFVTSASTVRITLSCEDSDAEVHIYRGPFLHDIRRIPRGTPTVVPITPPIRFPTASNAILASGAFSPEVWRVALGHASFLFHHIETFGHPIRPPSPNEKPSTTWIAYGSSITQSNLGGYPFHAARLLHWDVSGKGLSGSCHMEKEAADYLTAEAAATRAAFITAEVGVNMLAHYSASQFAKRAAYLVEALRKANPQSEIALITAFTHSAHHPRDQSAHSELQKEFDQILRSQVRDSGDNRLHLLEGTELLPDFTLLNSDVIHPSPSGHADIGKRLAEKLKAIETQSK